MRLVPGIGDGAGAGLGVRGQPGRAIQVPGLSSCGGHLDERLRLVPGIGDGASEGLGVIEMSKPRPNSRQADWNVLVTDGYCMPVDGQFYESLKVRHVLVGN